MSIFMGYQPFIKALSIHTAWCIMKSCCIHLNSSSLRHKKSFNLRCLICKIVFHIFSATKQQNHICCRNINF